MNAQELTNDDILYILDCLKVGCACRDDCIDCPYADEFGCTLKHIPSEWRTEALKKEGD